MVHWKKLSIVSVVISYLLFLLSVTGWAETEPDKALNRPTVNIYPEELVLKAGEPFTLLIELDHFTGALQDLNVRVNGEKADAFFHSRPIVAQTKGNRVVYILRQVKIEKPGEISIDANFIIDGKPVVKNAAYQAN